MIDRTGHVLAVAARSLREVVAPALDSADPLALEQARIVADTLDFLTSRTAHERDRTRRTLQVYAELGAALDHPPVAEVRTARGLLVDPDAEPEALTASLAALTAAIGVALRSPTDPQARRRDARAVLRHSRVVVDMERAWFSPFGYDPEPDSVPPLAEALAPVRRPAGPTSPHRPSTRK